MSSKFVRDTLTAFLTSTFPTAKKVDLTAQYDQLEDVLTASSITRNDPWLGLEFIGGEEVPITLNANGVNSGKYREIGVVQIQIVDIAKLGVGAAIITRAEALRSAFRGRNLSGVRIDSVTTPRFNDSSTLQFEGGWTSASILISYEYDVNL